MKRTSIPNDMCVLNEIVPTSDEPTGLVVHLRLGDVIENHSRTVESFLRGNVIDKLSTDCMGSLEWKGSSTGAGSEGYVQPAVYYIDIIEDYLKNGDDTMKKVTLIGGTHKNISMVKSLHYVEEIKTIFETRGFTVVERISTCPSIASADADFTVMANATVFIPSGGGYSGLAAQLVTMRGNRVYDRSTSNS